MERGQFADVKPFFWQTDTAIALNSWCYTENNEYRPAADIICDLIDIVSKNGCLLLNVGPKADGTISREDRNVLLEIGRWLKVNGEAVYGSRVWRKYGEGPTKVEEGQFTDRIRKHFTPRDFRFTTANGYLYAAVLACSESGEYVIESLAEQDASKLPKFHGIIRSVQVLGSPEPPEWSRDEAGLHIRTKVSGGYPLVFKISVD